MTQEQIINLLEDIMLKSLIPFIIEYAFDLRIKNLIRAKISGLTDADDESGRCLSSFTYDDMKFSICVFKPTNLIPLRLTYNGCSIPYKIEQSEFEQFLFEDNSLNCIQNLFMVINLRDIHKCVHVQNLVREHILEFRELRKHLMEEDKTYLKKIQDGHCNRSSSN